MWHDQISYDLRREADERAAAAAATEPSIRRAHLELADRYADRARRNQEALALSTPTHCPGNTKGDAT